MPFSETVQHSIGHGRPQVSFLQLHDVERPFGACARDGHNGVDLQELEEEWEFSLSFGGDQHQQCSLDSRRQGLAGGAKANLRQEEKVQQVQLPSIVMHGF